MLALDPLDPSLTDSDVDGLQRAQHGPSSYLGHILCLSFHYHSGVTKRELARRKSEHERESQDLQLRGELLRPEWRRRDFPSPSCRLKGSARENCHSRENPGQWPTSALGGGVVSPLLLPV
jgi:hypothetical protein